ncbi:MAG TPA: fenitrothion hydrolase [Solirubrobacteraceae bacterium]|nr:fenitrothion hydrolase [Solirubrobacteraceae bacterium]
MSVPPRRRLPALAGAIALAGLAAPAVADAHGIVGKADLPIPVWLFSWAAAIVLVVSFVALSTLWRTPQLQQEGGRRLASIPRALDVLAGAAGIFLFALVVYSGLDGAQEANANLSVTFVYVIFWVGTPVLSVLLGDVFAALSPWRSFARLLRWAARTARGGRELPVLGYPRWLGMWPAVAGIVGFAWLELVYLDRDHPATLAALSLGWFGAMTCGYLAFGVERWGSQADAFGVYFNLLSRLSPLVRRKDGSLWLRRPLSGVTGLAVGRGTVAMICAVIGTTTFDGFSNGGIWRNNEPAIQGWFSDLGLSLTPSVELAYSLGLVLCILLIGAVYRIGIAGVRSVSDRYTSAELAVRFAHTLVPIGFAYVLAHYFSLLLWQGQAIGYLISDPLGEGANIFGTAHATIDYDVISYAGIWYVQVSALLLGHVAGLALAHDRALVLYREPEEAVRSQYWMLAVMVAFTSFGLWLLSSVGT